MNNALLKMYQNGQLHNIKKKWDVLQPQCTPLLRRGNPLSFSKLISLFAIIATGMLIASFVMVYECIAKPKKEVLKPNPDFEMELFKSIFQEVDLCLKNNGKPSNNLLISLRNSLTNTIQK